MSTTRPASTCRRCEASTPDHAFLCTKCGHRLATRFGEVAGLAEDLLVSLSRRARIDRPPTPLDPEDHQHSVAATLSIQPLPVDLAAGEHLAALRTTVAEWADSIARVRGYARPLGTWEAVGTFLVHQVPWLRYREEGPVLLEEIEQMRSQVRRFVDRPTPTWYAGPCGAHYLDDDGLLQECDADLHALSGADQVTCRGCDTTHDVGQRRQWLLGLAEDRLLRAEHLARAVTVLAEPVTSAQIRGYAFRKRLVPKGRDAGDHPLYRVGDLLELIREDLQQPTKKTAKAGA